MPSQSMHFIQIKHFLKWDRRVVTIKQEGLNLLNYESGKSDNLYIPFKNVISITYQFGSNNELSFTWNKQTTSGYKQTTWHVFSHDRDHFLSEYYRYYDKWRTLQPQYLYSIAASQQIQCHLLHDNLQMESIKVDVKTSEMELFSQGEVVDRFKELKCVSEKSIELMEDEDTQKSFTVPFVDVGLIVEYKDAVELFYKSSHIKVTLLFVEGGGGSPDNLIQLILKRENQFLGFVNRIEDKKSQVYEDAAPVRFPMNSGFAVDKVKHIFEQTRTQRWEYPTFLFQMFAWKTLSGGRYQRRVLLAIDDKCLVEYDECILKGMVELTLLNRYPLKAIIHIVRTDFLQAMVTVKLIFRDRSLVQYTFEPFQRDTFITTLYHYMDCNALSGQEGDGQSKLDQAYSTIKYDSFSSVPMSSTEPDFSRKVYGWQDNLVSPAYERYILQLFCSSKDEWSFFENTISLRLNLQLRDFLDNQISPLLCLIQMAERVFKQYIDMSAPFARYLRCHRVLRVLNKSPSHIQISKQLQDMKRAFAKHFNIQPQSDDLSQHYVDLSVEKNPVWRALQLSLVCTYTSYEEQQDLDQFDQYVNKRDEMIRIADQLKQSEEQELDQEAVQLLILKMEEILILMIKLIDAPALYRELMHSKRHQEMFDRVINYVGELGCTCPHPLISFVSNQFLSKLCYNWVAQGQGSGIKSKLLRDNFMTKLVHSFSTYTLVNDADSFHIHALNVSRQSMIILNNTNKNKTKNSLLYAKSLPHSLFREELYTLHIVGFLRLLEAFICPHSRECTYKYDLKLLLQYLQTPYFIAVMTKLVNYKSHNIQFRTTTILANILDLLRIENLDPQLQIEMMKPIPCSALLMYSRNYEMIQTLILKRSTIIVRFLHQLHNVSHLRYIMNVWTLSLICKNNLFTCALLARTYPTGLFYHISVKYHSQNQISYEDCRNFSTLCIKLSKWDYSEWEIFFLQLKQDYYLPEVVWGECERVLTYQELVIYDQNFTFSQAIFLRQQQVDLITQQNHQQDNFLQGIENDLFRQNWNISEYGINLYSLSDLWLVDQYYLRILLQSEEYIHSIPNERLTSFFQSLFVAYLDPMSQDQHMIVTKAFVLIYRLHSSTHLQLSDQFIRAIVKNGQQYLSRMKDDSSIFNMVQIHGEAMYVIANVYENELLKNQDDLRIVWDTYQRNVLVLVREGLMDFITEIFARSVYEESLDNTPQSTLRIPILVQQQSQDCKNTNWNKLKILLLDIVRVCLLTCHTNDNIQMEPYPVVKQTLIVKDNGLRMHVLLNQLIFDEEVTPKVKHMIIQIISKQLDDTQALLSLSRIPIFVEALIYLLKSQDTNLIHGVVNIFKNLYQAFLNNAPKQVIDRVSHYLNLGMFIRQVPYEEEREAITYLPYLRVLPFQLARKLIHQMPTEESQQIFSAYESYDLLWNRQQSDTLFQYIDKSLHEYKIRICARYNIESFPCYQNVDGSQFRVIPSELQCGHIFLRVWSTRGNKDRKSQVPPEVSDLFVKSVHNLLHCLIEQTKTDLDLNDQIEVTQFTIVLRSYYYCVKLFKQFDDIFLEHLCSTLVVKLNAIKHHDTSHLEITVLICKMMTQYTLANRAVPHQTISAVLEFLSAFRKCNSQHGVTLGECKLLYYSLSACRPTNIQAMEFGLQIFQLYCELCSHSGAIVDKQFTESQLALDAMFKLPAVLGKCVLSKSEDIKQAQQMIQAGIMWRVVHLVTLFNHFQVTHEQEDRKSTIKRMLVQFAFALRNILFLSRKDDHLSQFKQQLQNLFVPAFTETLLEDAKSLTTLNDQDRTAVGRFLLKVAADIQEPTLQWNEQTRKDLRSLLNRQLSKNQGFNFNDNKEDEPYLSQFNKNESPSLDLPNGFLIKVLTTMLSSNKILIIQESANTVHLILNENPSLIATLYNEIGRIHNLLIALPALIKTDGFEQQNDVYFSIIKNIYSILQHMMSKEEGIQLILKQKPLIVVLTQLARFANKEHQHILLNYLTLISKLYDFNDHQSIQELVVFGCVGVLFECIFKVEQLTLELRLESFTLFRQCIKNEYDLFTESNQPSRDQNQLETLRLIQLLPIHLSDLLTSDQEEEIILDNFYKEWNTPSLMWTTRMMKEVLLTVVQYNTLKIGIIEQVLKDARDDLVQKYYLKVTELQPPIYTELSNELLVDSIILREYNQQPHWPLSIPMLDFLLELSVASDTLLEQHNELLLKQTTTLVEKRSFNRLCCSIITYLTSFQLALEQYFYNKSHPEFRQMLPDDEDLTIQKIQEELQKQRDRIPESISRKLPSWCETLHDTRVHTNIRTSVLQILYILCDSDLALVLQGDKFYSTIFKVLESVFILKSVSYTKAEQILLLIIIHNIISRPFVRSNLIISQFTIILTIYDLLQSEAEMATQTQIIVTILTKFSNDDTRRDEIITLINKSDNRIKLLLAQERSIPLPIIWRTQFGANSHPFLAMEDQRAILFPTVSQFACEPLPHIPDQILQRQSEEDILYKSYVRYILTSIHSLFRQLNQVTVHFTNLEYETLIIQSIKYGQLEVNSVQEKKKQKYSMVSNDDVFS